MLQGKRLRSGRWHLGQGRRSLSGNTGLRSFAHQLSDEVLGRHIHQGMDGLYPESWLEYRRQEQLQQLQQTEQVNLTQLTLKLGLELSEYYLSNVEQRQSVMQVNNMYRTLMNCLTALETRDRELVREIREQVVLLHRTREGEKQPLPEHIIHQAQLFKQFNMNRLEQLQQVDHNNYYATSPTRAGARTQREPTAQTAAGTIPSSKRSAAKAITSAPMTPPPAWKWDMTAYRRVTPLQRSQVQTHREQLIQMLEQTTREEQEIIWRELRSQRELKQLVKRVEQDDPHPTPELLELVRSTTSKEYIRLLQIMERRFVYRADGELRMRPEQDPIPMQGAYPTGRSHAEASRDEKQILTQRAQPMLVWLENTLKAGRVRREKMLQHLEQQPEILRQAFLTLAGDSGIFSEKSLPRTPQSTNQERLTLLVRKSSRRELERLVEWAALTEKQDPLTDGSASEPREQKPTAEQNIIQQRPAAETVIRDTAQERPASRTLVYFLAENPIETVVDQTASGSGAVENVMRQLSHSAAAPLPEQIQQPGAYEPLWERRLEPLSYREERQNRQETGENQHPQQTGKAAEVPSAVRISSPETPWEGTPMYRRTHYDELETAFRTIRRLSVREIRDGSDETAMVPSSGERQDISAAAVLSAGNLVSRWLDIRQFSRLRQEETLVSRQYLNRHVIRRAEKRMEADREMVLRETERTLRQYEEQSEVKTKKPPEIARTNQPMSRRDEAIYDTNITRRVHHKTQINRTVAETLETAMELAQSTRITAQKQQNILLQQTRQMNQQMAQTTSVIRQQQERLLERRQLARQVEETAQVTREQQELLREIRQTDRQLVQRTQTTDQEQQNTLLQQTRQINQQMAQTTSITREQQELLQEKRQLSRRVEETTQVTREQRELLREIRQTDRQLVQRTQTTDQRLQSTLLQQTRQMNQQMVQTTPVTREQQELLQEKRQLARQVEETTQATREQRELLREIQQTDRQLVQRTHTTQQTQQDLLLKHTQRLDRSLIQNTRNIRDEQEQRRIQEQTLQRSDEVRVMRRQTQIQQQEQSSVPQRREEFRQIRTLRQETSVLSRLVQQVRENVSSAKRVEEQIQHHGAGVGQQVFAKMVRDGEARILDRQIFVPEDQRVLQVRQQTPSPELKVQADLELRKAAQPQQMEQTAAKVAKDVLEANIQQQSPEIRVLRRQSQEQSRVLQEQQEQLTGLRKQLEQQQAQVQQTVEKAMRSAQEPVQIRKIAKAVMREMEDQIRVERQRRGMK